MLAEHELLARAAAEEAEKRTAIVGKPAPEWSTTDLGDKPRALKDFRGKVVILDFRHRSCFWCLRAMPQVKEIAAHFKDQPVVVLGMNTDAKLEDAQFVVKKMRLGYANLKVGYSATLKGEVMKAVERLLKEKR